MGSTDTVPVVLPSEAALLLATTGDETLNSRISEITGQPLDWDHFLRLTRRERAEAIVAARLHRAGVVLPEPVGRSLRAMAIRRDVQMALLSRRLDQTLEALVAAGIPVILLKGAALAKTVYGALPRRPMLDLDLLIPESARQRAREVALGTGWIPGPLEDAQQFYQDHYHLPPFYDRDGGDFSLELHHDLFFRGHPFALAIEDLWQRCVPLAGYPGVSVLSGPQLVLHLALHFAWSHTMRSAAWRTLRDLRVLTEAKAVDWDDVTREARRARGASCCYWTFRLARQWSGAPVPDAVLQALQPPALPAMLAILDRHIASQWYSGGIRCPSVRLERLLWRMAVRPAWSGHGTVVPWQRDEFFPADEADPAEPTPSPKLARHLGRLGSYVDYFRQILAI